MSARTNRSTHRPFWALVALLLAVSAPAAAACGVASAAPRPAEPEPTVDTIPTGETEPDTTTTIPASFETAGEWSWVVETARGQQSGRTLTLGHVQRVTDGAGLPGFDDPKTDLAVACGSFDTTTAALIPATLVLHNGTQGVANALYSSLFLVLDDDEVTFSNSETAELGVAVAYGDSIDCNAIGTLQEVSAGDARGWNYAHEDRLEPGASAPPHHAYLILPDYYTPDTPDGDPGRLDHIGLGLAGNHFDDRLVELTGPDSTFGPSDGEFLLASLVASSDTTTENVTPPSQSTEEPGADQPEEATEAPGTDEPTQTDGSTPDSRPIDLTGCPEVPSGVWSGNWVSHVAGIHGTVKVDVQLDESKVTGSLDLDGPSHATLVDSGAMSGTRECLTMSLSVADDTIELVGEISTDGTTVTGIYDATLNGGTIFDQGAFTLNHAG